MEILKRSVVVVISKTAIYWRLPNPLEMVVSCMSWQVPDILKDSAKPIMANYKKQGPPPADHEARVLWETAWLQEALRQHDHPHAPSPAPPCTLPAAVRVKRERVAFTRALSAQTLRGPINLDSPSPSPKRSRAAVPNPDFPELHSADDAHEVEMTLSQELANFMEEEDGMDVAADERDG